MVYIVRHFILAETNIHQHVGIHTQQKHHRNLIKLISLKSCILDGQNISSFLIHSERRPLANDFFFQEHPYSSLEWNQTNTASSEWQKYLFWLLNTKYSSFSIQGVGRRNDIVKALVFRVSAPPDTMENIRIFLVPMSFEQEHCKVQ